MSKTNNDRLADEVRILTYIIRGHQEAIVESAKKRREKVMKLREDQVTYREIAEIMGTTEQSVYKIIRQKPEKI
jgi:DNA-directed RNA polymerase specialized sigma24 family protein